MACLTANLQTQGLFDRCLQLLALKCPLSTPDFVPLPLWKEYFKIIDKGKSKLQRYLTLLHFMCETCPITAASSSEISSRTFLVRLRIEAMLSDLQTQGEKNYSTVSVSRDRIMRNIQIVTSAHTTSLAIEHSGLRRPWSQLVNFQETSGKNETARGQNAMCFYLVNSGVNKTTVWFRYAIKRQTGSNRRRFSQRPKKSGEIYHHAWLTSRPVFAAVKAISL